jgi:excisionase family DNA binding protein
MEEMLSVRDVTKILKLSRQKLCGLIRDKKIKAIRIDGQYRIKPSDLQEYIKSMQV